MFLVIICYESSFDIKMQPFLFLRNILINTSDLESFLLKHFRCTHFIILYKKLFIFGESEYNSRHLRRMNLDTNYVLKKLQKKVFFLMFIVPCIADLYQ